MMLKVSPRMDSPVSRIALATILAIMLAAPASAQPCNPVIDGTYCATQGGSVFSSPTGSGSSGSMEGLGAGISSFGPNPGNERDDPGTFGAITFGGGSRCISGLFRSKCN